VFDADGDPGNGFQKVTFNGSLDIGSVPPFTVSRVAGNGLSLLNPTGNLAIGTLNAANSGGNGLRVEMPVGTDFNLSVAGGTIDTDGGDFAGVAISTDSTSSLCLNLTGMSVAGSGSANDIQLDQSGSSTLGITQALLTDLSNDNGGASVGTTGTVSFGCAIP